MEDHYKLSRNRWTNATSPPKGLFFDKLSKRFNYLTVWKMLEFKQEYTHSMGRRIQTDSSTERFEMEATQKVRNPVEKIRVSSGSAVVLDLIEGFLNANPTTAYLLTYLEGKCSANCAFCPQARSSSGNTDMLSRVTWPIFGVDRVFSKLANSVQRRDTLRVCIQALNYPNVLQDLLTIAETIKSEGITAPISISCQPLNKEEMKKLKEAGVERLGISLDAATESIFSRVKGNIAGGPYSWERHCQALLEAVEVFGKGRISTHLIVGLGETELEMTRIIQWCVDNHVNPALFAFTPIPKTTLEDGNQPALSHYRRIQLARHLIVKGETRFDKMVFEKDVYITSFGVSQEVLRREIRSGTPFRTSGCPNCNRPYYNEKPSGPIYNFPIQPSHKEVEEIRRQLRTFLDGKN